MSANPAEEGQEPTQQQTEGQEPTGGTQTQGETPEQKAARLERELAEARKDAGNYRTRLRERERAEQEAQRQTAEQQGEFKTLYEQAQQRLQELEQAQAARERADLLRKVAKSAGLDPDDEDLVSRLRGDDEEALLEDAKKLAARIAPPADPDKSDKKSPANAGSAANGTRSGRTETPTFDPKNPPRLSNPSLWKR